MRTVRVEVTITDIHRGERCIATTCPVALAIQRVVGTDDVWVETNEIRVGDRLCRMSDDVLTFIEDFDDGDPVKPFAFSLEVP